MNHDGLFWICRSGGGYLINIFNSEAYPNKKHLMLGEDAVVISENLTYEEAEALVLFMGGIFRESCSGFEQWGIISDGG